MGSGVSHLYDNTHGSQLSFYVPTSTGDNGTGGIPSGGAGSYTGSGKSLSEQYFPGDMVVLIRKFKGLPVGTIGKILSKVDKSHYKVDFYDEEHHSTAVLVTPRSYIRRLDKDSSDED